MRRLALFAACSVVPGVLAVAAPAAAAADLHIPLSMTAVTDIVVDDAHGHVYLVGGGSNGVVVRSLTGAAVATIENQPGASSMALSADGSTLYVALRGGDAISAVDTTTLTEKARYATGASTCPTYVTLAPSQVWFGYGCSSTGQIGVVDLSGEEPAITLDRLPETVSVYGAPHVVMSPADPTRMVAGTHGLSPATIRSFGVAGTTLTSVAAREVGSYLNDLSITPDGVHVVTASGAPYEHPRYKVADLSSDGVYTTDAYPRSVAHSAGGYVAAGIDGIYDPDIYVFSAGGTLRRKYELDGCCPPTSNRSLAAGTLAFNTDGSRLYAASTAYQSGYVLHVFSDPTKSTSTITLTKPATTPKVGTAYSVTGTLSGTLPVGAGRTVHVKRVSKYGTKTMPDVTTGSGGTFTITDKVSKRGTFTYTAWWDGDADHAGTTKSLSVLVRGLTPSLSITTNATAYNYQGTARVLAHLGTTYTNRSVSILATPLDRSVRTVTSGRVDSSGNLRATHSLYWKTTYTASFAGDDVYEPRKVTRTVRVYAAPSQAISGHYGTSNGYKLFRRTVDPTVTTTVRPSTNGCVAMTAQRYTDGAWRTFSTASCIGIGDGSQAIGILTGDPMVGVPYRIKSTFAGNTYLLAKGTAYQYLRFT